MTANEKIVHKRLHDTKNNNMHSANFNKVPIYRRTNGLIGVQNMNEKQLSWITATYYKH